MQGICLQCGETKGIHPQAKKCNACRKANTNHVLNMLREERTELLASLKAVLYATRGDHDKWALEYAKALATYSEIASKVDKFSV